MLQINFSKIVIWIPILYFAIFIEPVAGMEVYKYYKIDKPKHATTLSYIDKKALNVLYIRADNPTDIVTISVAPFDEFEYGQIIERRKNSSGKLNLETLFITVNGRKIEVFQETFDTGMCYFFSFDYYMHMAFLYEYTGYCNNINFFIDTIASMKYSVSDNGYVLARGNLEEILSKIDAFTIPTVERAKNVSINFDFLGLSKRIQYEFEVEKQSFTILKYYEIFFSSHSWKILPASNEQNEWINGKLLCNWVDPSEEIEANLIVTRRTLNSKLDFQEVFISITPFNQGPS